MYYVSEKGTATFEKLKELFDKRQAYNEQAVALAEELTGVKSPTVLGKPFSFGGGLSGIALDQQPTNWKKVRSKHAGYTFYMPKAIQKDTWKRIEELPELKWKPLEQLLSFDFYFSRPGIVVGDAKAVIEYPKKHPLKGIPSDLREVTYSEYLCVESEIMAEREAKKGAEV